MSLFTVQCVGSHTVGPNPSDSRVEPLSETKLRFLNPCHCWIPRMTVVSQYRQLTGQSSCGADALYFYTEGARFESGPGHCVSWLRILFQSFIATAVILRVSGHGRWPPNSVHFIIPQLFWRSTVCSVRRLKCVATVTQASLHFRARSQNCEKRLLPSSWLSVLPTATTRLPLDRFSWNLLF